MTLIKHMHKQIKGVKLHPVPYKGERISYGGTALLTRPMLCSYLMNITSSWALLEQKLGMLMAEILGTEGATGIEMYYAVQGENTKDNLMIAAASSRMEEDFQKRLKTVLQEITTARTIRARVAHGVWGVEENNPDSLILMGKQASAVFHAYSQQAYGPYDNDRVKRRSEQMEQYWYSSLEYRKEHFEEWQEIVNTAAEKVHGLFFELFKGRIEADIERHR